MNTNVAIQQLTSLIRRVALRHEDGTAPPKCLGRAVLSIGGIDAWSHRPHSSSLHQACRDSRQRCDDGCNSASSARCFILGGHSKEPVNLGGVATEPIRDVKGKSPSGLILRRTGRHREATPRFSCKTGFGVATYPQRFYPCLWHDEPGSVVGMNRNNTGSQRGTDSGASPPLSGDSRTRRWHF
jgi:hypothetical protein